MVFSSVTVTALHGYDIRATMSENSVTQFGYNSNRNKYKKMFLLNFQL